MVVQRREHAGVLRLQRERVVPHKNPMRVADRHLRGRNPHLRELAQKDRPVALPKEEGRDGTPKRNPPEAIDGHPALRLILPLSRHEHAHIESPRLAHCLREVCHKGAAPRPCHREMLAYN